VGRTASKAETSKDIVSASDVRVWLDFRLPDSDDLTLLATISAALTHQRSRADDSLRHTRRSEWRLRARRAPGDQQSPKPFDMSDIGGIVAARLRLFDELFYQAVNLIKLKLKLCCPFQL
jgi:hypothetical protein